MAHSSGDTINLASTLTGEFIAKKNSSLPFCNTIPSFDKLFNTIFFLCMFINKQKSQGANTPMILIMDLISIDKSHLATGTFGN